TLSLCRGQPKNTHECEISLSKSVCKQTYNDLTTKFEDDKTGREGQVRSNMDGRPCASTSDKKRELRQML
ncbi:MAG: hypothetical protein ACKPKO_52930, partial [Candidatus Fonsibacter sp.]